MIASHDSFTYSKPKNFIYKLFTGIWRTQNVTLQKQYTNYKVRYFDIRIYKDKDKWIICHGAVDFIYEYDSIAELCQDIESRFPEAYYRIVLEKGEDEYDFRKEICFLNKSENLDEVVVKKDWVILRGTKFKIVDQTCKMNTLKEKLRMFKYKFSIKNWSKKNNPKITDDMVEDKKIVYYLDYVNI